MKNVIWLSGGVAIGRILRSIMIIYAARILGAEGYGIFSYGLSFAAVFTIFADIGLTPLLTRELVKRNEKSEYLATSLVLKLALVGFTVLLIVFASPYFTNIEAVKPLLALMAGLVAFDSIRGFLFAISRAENRMQFEAIFEILIEVTITLVGFWVLLNFPSVENFTLGYFAASMLGLLVLLFVMRKYLFGTLFYFRRELVASILRSVGPFAFMGVFGVFMSNIDLVIVGFLRPTKDLGLLAAAQKPIAMLYLIPGFLYAALLPFMSKFIRDNESSKFSLLLRKSVLVTLVFALPIVVGGIIVASPVINVIYDYSYIGAVLAFQILLLSLIPIFPGMMLSTSLLASDKQKIFIKSSIIGAIVNVTLDLVLIPLYGIVGSAMATVGAQLAINSIFWWEIRKSYSINIWGDLAKMMLSVVIMASVVYILKSLLWPLIAILLIAGFVYFGFLFVLKEEIFEDVKEGLHA